MTTPAFELGEYLTLRKIEYKISDILWAKYDFPEIDISFNKWHSIKYLNDDGTAFNGAINDVPNNSGGLYLFYAKCHIIPGITEYPFYIGRAQFTENQNLRKRVKVYFQKYRLEDERPKITKMFKYWANDLYLAFLPLETNEAIIDYEKRLINALLLPMNTEIPDKEVRDATVAFKL